jgi:hypothetical protein
MNAIAPVFAERHCTCCWLLKPREEFAAHPTWCRECKSKYMRDRYAAQKAGTWKAKPREEYRRPRSIPQPARNPAANIVPFGAETVLRAAMVSFLMAFGFTALRATLTRLEGEIAREHREQLAREGWIA